MIKKFLAKWNDERGFFGRTVDYGEAMKPEHDLVVLCEAPNTGYKPIKLLLPHQVYSHDLDPKKQYVAFLVNSADVIEIEPIPEEVE